MANDVQDFRLNIGLDTDTALKDAENLQKEIKKIFESRSGQESPQLNKLDIQLKTLFTKIQKVVDSMRSVGEQEFMTSAFAQATKELEKVEKQYDSLMGKADRMNAIEQRRAEILGEIEANNRRIENLKNTSVVAGYNAMINSAQNGGQFDDTQYQKALSAVRQLNEENNKLQSKLAQLQYVRLDNYYNEVDSVKKKLEELRDLVQSMEISGSAYVAGTDTAQFAALSQQLDETIDKTKLRLVQRETQAEKEQDIINREVATERAAVQSREDFFRELTQVILNECATREMTMEELAAADRREKEAEITASQDAIDAEQRLLNQQMERRRKAQEALDAHNQSYNRVREGLMGIQSTTRGIARLIPGLNTSAIYGVTAITRGVSRLANMTKDEWAGAINNVKKSYGKLFTFISSHPIITSLTGIAVAITAVAIISAKAFNEFKEKITDFLTEVGEATETILSTVVKGFKAVIPVFAAVDKAIRTVTVGVIALLAKGVIKLISGIVSLSSSIESTIKEMVKLENGINDINTAVSNLISSLSFLENSFGAVFANALTMVEPVLTRFIDLSAEAINAVGMLFAKLLGADSYTKVIRKQRDFNDELDKTNSKTKEQLAQFDKLNVISKSSQSNKKDKENTSDYEAISLELMTIDELIDNVKGKGEAMGQSLKDTLADIDWNQVVIDAGKAGKAIGGFITEFQGVGGLDVELGEALAGIFNAFVNFFTELGETIDGFELGKTLGTIVQTFIDNLDAEKVGQLITNILNGIIRALRGFFESINGYRVGKKLLDIVQEFIDNFDFEEFGKMLSSGFDTLIDVITGWVENITPQDIQKVVDKLTTTVESFLKGIQWWKIFKLVDFIAIRFVAFFNSVFKPEKMKRVGEVLSNLIKALFRGIKILAEDADWKTWGKSIAEGISEVFAKLDAKDMAETVSNLAVGLLNMITSALSSMNWKTFADKLVEFISNIKWEDLTDSLLKLSHALGTAFETVINKFIESDDYERIISLIANLWLEKEKWETRFKGLSDTISEAVTKEVLDAKTKINAALWDKTTQYAFEGPYYKDVVRSQVVGDVEHSSAATVFYDVGKPLGEDIANGIADGMSEQVNSSTFQTAMDKVTADAEKAMRERTAWNSHSPAQSMIPLGKDIVDGIVKGMSDYDFTTAMTTWYDTKVKPWFDAEYWTKISNGITSGIKAQMKLTKSAMLGNWVLIKEKSGDKVDKLVLSITKKFNTLRTTLDKTNTKINSGFVDTFTNIATNIKTPLQSIINTFASFTDKIIDCTNSMITNLNTLKIDMPEWLTGSSDKTFSFGLSKISHVDVPKLAQGAVIPPSMSQFLAVLGDNKRETEVVSPLSTIEQALRNVMGEQKVTFEIVGDPHGMFRVMQKEAGNYTRATGRLAF